VLSYAPTLLAELQKQAHSYGAIARLSLPVQTTAAVAFTPESARIVVPIAAHISELRNVISYLRRPVGIRAQSLVKTAP
jgi:hypothetical protein